MTSGNLSFVYVLLFSFMQLLQSAFAQTYTHPTTDDEFTGPFNSWLNVKTNFGAVGNGTTDDTKALQAAFDAIGIAGSTASVVYIPAGTYRITSKLTMNYKMNVSVIGADPATTIIKWDGGMGGAMLLVSGTAYSRFNRLTFNGNLLASYGVDQSYNGVQGNFDTGNEYADDVFTDVGVGIRGGFLGYGFAETAIMRCRFIRNTIAGVSLGNFNAINAWVWHSVFQDCNIGVTNMFGAGNFQVYNSIFSNSTTSDIYIDDTGIFALRDNTSINSKTFLLTGFHRYPCPTTIQGNTIIDPVSTTAISIRNQGPTSLVDNVIRSRAGATGSVVAANGDPSGDLFCMGNTYTLTNPISATSRKIVFDKPVVSRESLSNLQPQQLPATPPVLNRQVFEVPKGADANIIQQVINQAALVAGTRPIVHFAHGTYFVNTTLVIPAASDMQLTGDGEGDVSPTWLSWTGSSSGPVLLIEGPSKATVRDLSIHGNNMAAGIKINNADQTGSRVFMHQVEAHLNSSNLLVNGLDNTLVWAQNSRFSASKSNSVKVTGGQQAATGSPQQGKTVLYAGLAFDNKISYEVNDGGSLITRDIWYESIFNYTYLKLNASGVFTSDGCRIASPVATTVPAMEVSNLSGKATFLNMHIEDRVAISGNGSQAKVMGLGVLSFGSSYVSNTTSPAADVKTLNSRIVQDANTVFPRSGSRAAVNSGSIDSMFIATMLAQARDVHSHVLNALPTGVTDIRFYRVWSYATTNGIEINGSGQTGDDFGLSSLVMNEAALSPVFNKDSLSYSTSVASGVAAVSFIVQPSGNGAVVSINGLPVESGQTSAPVPVQTGNNPVFIQVSRNGLSKVYTVNVKRAAAVHFAGKVFLQGAYNKITGAMNNSLNNPSIMQAEARLQPYAGLPFNYPGNEQVSSAFFTSHAAIVDWILIELRDSVSPQTVVARRAAFVTSDGNIMDTSGSATVLFENVAPARYYVAVRHRNHLGVRSAQVINFVNEVAVYDFSASADRCYQSQLYTSTVKAGLVWCMRGGNANFNNNVRFNGPANDQDQLQNIALGGFLSAVLVNRYASEDLNMDGKVRTNGPANDQDFLLNLVLGGMLSVIYYEQL